MGLSTEPQDQAAEEARSASDAALLAAVGKRDARALESLVARHGDWAFGFVFRLSGNRQLAEEVVQSAFLRLWQRADAWEGRSRFSTWFYRVLHNLAIDRMRRLGPAAEALDEALPDPADGPEQATMREQRDARVRAALAALPERQRAAIVLSHYEGRSQTEASAILGISEGALESLLSRARASLRIMLAAERRLEE